MFLEEFCKKINLLSEGKTLVLNHSVYGIFKIKMNPQGNRIFIDEVIQSTQRWKEEVEESKNCLADEDKILSLLFWGCTDTYVLEKKEKEPLSKPDAWEKLNRDYNLVRM